MSDNRASIIPVKDENEQIKDGIKSALDNIFPIIGKKNELHLTGLNVDEVEADPYNIKAQYDAKMLGRTYAAPFYATLQLKDKETGKVLQNSKIKMGNIPLVTHRGSYIVDGNEYYTSSLVRKKPGIYARIAENGVPFVEINSAKGRNMKLHLEDNGQLNLEMDKKNIPVLPLLRAIGTPDEAMKKAWGDSIFTENLKKSHLVESAINKAHAAMYYDTKPKDMEDGIAKIKHYLDNSTEFRPEVNKITLGESYTKLTPQAIVDAAGKLIKLKRKDIDPDDSEHLAFKTVHSTGDLMKERLEKMSKNIKFKWVRNVDKGDTIGSIMGSAPFDGYLHSLFNEFPNINVGEQTNPLTFVTNFHKTTVFGPGAIKDEHAVTKENQNVSISQFGFMDVFHTPEKQAGLVNQITPGTFKKGTSLYKMVFDKKGDMAKVSPVDLLDKSIAFADQIKIVNGKPEPLNKKSVMAVKGGKIVDLPWDQVDYAMPNHAMYFDQATNMIPFVNSDHGNRSYMAGKHMEQSLPLVHREAPLVQANLMTDDGHPLTMEDMIGKDFSVKSPVDGVIEKIDKDKMTITVKGKDGKSHNISFYHNFHLNGGGFISSDFQKKVGDTVKEDELIADSNFTRDGKLALGRNMTVAYMPYKGYNFEDGLVISEKAAKDLTSEHSHEETLTPEDEDIVNKKKFIAFAPSMFTSDQLSKLDEDGVVTKGSILQPGDPMILYLKKKVVSAESNMLGRISKALNMPYKIEPLTWEGSVPAEVIGTSRVGQTIKVILKTEEPMNVGDKIAGRHGNKGVITAIIPDAQMPRTVGGEPIDILYSPVYILGRTNIGQLMEIAAGKIAKKTGKTYFARNFSKGNYSEDLTKELKQNGLTDKESVYDPSNGKTYHGIAVGPEYIVKMHHQVDHKISSRYPDKYDANMQPVKGGEHSATAIDRLTFNSLLAHGAKSNLYEAATYKSEKNDEFWRAFESNRALPAPRIPFVFNKLLDMIKAMGVNVHKDGTRFSLLPATSKEILEQSAGEVTNPLGYRGKDLAEIEGGIFDPKITGGLKGEKWSHITLAEPVPNPLFSDAILKITKLKGAQLEDLVAGKLKLTSKNELVTDGEGLTGGKAIRKLLQNIDLNKRMEELKDAAKVAKGDALNGINQESRYIEALQRTGIKPEDAYVLDHLPVLPPVMRPVYPGSDGKVIISPLNHMYRFLIEANNQLKDMGNMPDFLKQDLRRDIYANTAALIGLQSPTVRMPSRDYKGLLEIIAGKDQPKHGFFHSKILSKRQDIAGRSVIALNNEIHPDQIGIPVKMAWDMYRPFIIRKLVQLGQNPIDAGKKVDEKHPLAFQALQKEMQERPVLVNRAPSLHKYSILAFNPVPVAAKTIQLNPLVVTGFNADFDGDSILISSKICINIEFEKNNKKIEKILDSMDLSVIRLYHNQTTGGNNMSLALNQQIGVKTTRTLVGPASEILPRLIKPTDKKDVSVPMEGLTVKVPSVAQNGEVAWSDISMIQVHATDKDMYEITTRTGVNLTSTQDHGLLTTNDDLAIVKIEPANILPGKTLMPKIIHTPEITTCTNIDLNKFSGSDKAQIFVDQSGRIIMNAALGYVLGHYLGDGRLDESGVYLYAFDSVQYAYLKSQVAEICNNYSEISKCHDNTSKAVKLGMVTKELNMEPSFTKMGIYIPSEKFSKFVSITCGEMRDRAVPSFAYSATHSFKKAMAGAYIACDCAGVKSASGSFDFRIWSTTALLRDTMSYLFMSLGIDHNIRETTKTQAKNPCNNKEYYKISILSSAFRPDKDFPVIHHSTKGPLFEEAKTRDDRKVDKDNNDLIPISNKLMAQLKDDCTRNKIATRRPFVESFFACMRRGSTYIPRTIAAKFLTCYFDYFTKNEVFNNFKALVDNTDLTWDIVESVKNIGPTSEPVFDFSVPGPQNFMIANGIVVHNTMQVYVPTLEESRKESFEMMPSKHLTNQGRAGIDLLMAPKREASGGLWYASYVENKTNKSYKTEEEAIKDYEDNKIALSDEIKINGKATTVGRTRLRKLIPSDIQFDNLDKKGQSSLLKEIYKKHPKEYASLVDRLNKFGNEVAAEGKLSFGVSDLNMPWMRNKRDEIVNKAMAKVKDKSNAKELVNALGENTRVAIMDLQKDIPIENALKRLQVAGMDKGVNTKGQSMTYLQLVGAPLLIEDVKKRLVPIPITKSYAEGLGLSEYLATSFGSRQGMADKASSTADPGALQKEIISATQSHLITATDCGTKRGIELSVDDADIMDRYLAEDIPGVGKRNDVTTPDLIAAAKKKKMTVLSVRSPLTCESVHGSCQKCAGLNSDGKEWALGTNLGVIAGHAAGEPVTQMAMKSFHQGGVYGGATIANSFANINQVLQVPKIYPNATTLSEHDGKVTKIEKDMLGNWVVEINGTQHKVPAGQKTVVSVGDKVSKGDPLGNGMKNPRDVLRLQGMPAARNHMVSELKRIYGEGGTNIRRVMFETVVKSCTDTTRVTDPGTSHLTPGDYARLSVVEDYNKRPYEEMKTSEALNRELYSDLPGISKGTKITKEVMDKLEHMGEKIIKAKRTPIGHKPELYGAAYFPLYFEEDWLARMGSTRLKDAIREGASFAQTSDLHGYNPVPAWAAGVEFGKSDDKIKY